MFKIEFLMASGSVQGELSQRFETREDALRHARAGGYSEGEYGIRRIWTTPDGDEIDAWAWLADGTVEVRLAGADDGLRWITWSAGRSAEDDVAWLRLCGVPRLGDRRRQ